MRGRRSAHDRDAGQRVRRTNGGDNGYGVWRVRMSMVVAADKRWRQRVWGVVGANDGQTGIRRRRRQAPPLHCGWSIGELSTTLSALRAGGNQVQRNVGAVLSPAGREQRAGLSATRNAATELASVEKAAKARVHTTRTISKPACRAD